MKCWKNILFAILQNVKVDVVKTGMQVPQWKNGSLKVTGGVLIVTGSDAIDSNGNFTISGGYVITYGNENIDINRNYMVNS